MLQSWAQIGQSIKWHINMLQNWPPMGQSIKGHTYFSGTPTELGTYVDVKGCSRWVPQYNSLGPILLSCSPTLQGPITLQVPITYWSAWESGVYELGNCNYIQNAIYNPTTLGLFSGHNRTEASLAYGARFISVPCLARFNTRGVFLVLESL